VSCPFLFGGGIWRIWADQMRLMLSGFWVIHANSWLSTILSSKGIQGLFLVPLERPGKCWSDFLSVPQWAGSTQIW
jgi:hypothetical protein